MHPNTLDRTIAPQANPDPFELKQAKRRTASRRAPCRLLEVAPTPRSMLHWTSPSSYLVILQAKAPDPAHRTGTARMSTAAAAQRAYRRRCPSPSPNPNSNPILAS